MLISGSFTRAYRYGVSAAKPETIVVFGGTATGTERNITSINTKQYPGTAESTYNNVTSFTTKQYTGTLTATNNSIIATNTFSFPGTLEPASSPDPYFANVELLMHFDGLNGGTTFTDNSLSPKSFSLSGAPVTSTTTFEFGTASGYFNGNSWLTLNTPIVFSGNYTLEGWLYTAIGSFQVAYNGSQVSIIGHGGNGGILGASGQYNSNSYILINGTPTNTWYYWALVQSGGTMTVYINGVASGSNSTPGGLNLSLSSIGRYNSPYGSYNFTGYIDELRLTQGVARYSSNFTPPTEPFPNS